MYRYLYRYALTTDYHEAAFAFPPHRQAYYINIVENINM